MTSIDTSSGFLITTLEVMSVLFITVIGLVVFVVIVLYVIDISQTKHAIRKNYPVVGRFRNFFEHLGEFFRQYFFVLDREELPFNRAVRSWVYQAANYAKNMTREVSTIAHSCGVKRPCDLTRAHARIVQQNGLSTPLEEIYPYPVGFTESSRIKRKEI